MIKQSIVVITFLISVGVNVAASILPLNGLYTGDITARFLSFFVPANYAFSIWALIYFALFFFVLYQALPSYRDNRVLDSIRPLFIGASIANAAWVFFWHYLVVPGSLIMMLVLLGFLTAIYIIVKKEKSFSADPVRKWTVMFPFSIYFAWIIVATLMNFTVFLIDLGWMGGMFPGEIWSALLIILATILGLYIGVRYRDNSFIFVIIWAFIALAVKFSFIGVILLSASAGVIVLLAGAFENWYKMHPGMFKRIGDTDIKNIR